MIASEEDWQKVVVTTVEADVAGLTRKGEVRAKATGATALSNQANIDARATEKLKREAARLGAHIILIQAQNTQRGSMGNMFQTAQAPQPQTRRGLRVLTAGKYADQRAAPFHNGAARFLFGKPETVAVPMRTS